MLGLASPDTSKGKKGNNQQRLIDPKKVKGNNAPLQQKEIENSGGLRPMVIPQKQRSNPKDITTSPNPPNKNKTQNNTNANNNNAHNKNKNNHPQSNHNNNAKRGGGRKGGGGRGGGRGFAIEEDVPSFIDTKTHKIVVNTNNNANINGNNVNPKKKNKKKQKKKKQQAGPGGVDGGDLDFEELFIAGSPPSDCSHLQIPSNSLVPPTQEELGEGGAPVSPKQERGSGGDDQDDDLNPELTEDDEGLIDNGERSFVPLKKGKVGLEDFKLLKLIGKGGFGKVYQVNKIDTGEIFAMKVLRKPFLISTDSVQGTKTERDILRQVRHPFIVSLHYAFQTKGKVYLVMDYMNGGQLFTHLRNESMFSENLVRFYAAEIVLALEHLHSLGIVHRDLKPENILLDAEGHISITDFGLAKEMKQGERTSTWCGTLEYMAPEMLKGEGYNKSADWWSVGILVYDMLTGNPPFKSGNNGTLQKKILTDKLRMPPYFSPEVTSFLKKMLERDVSKRLGSGKGGAREIKSHPFFKPINWKKLASRNIEPPFRPQITRGMMDTSNFDSTFTSVFPIDSPVNSLEKITNSQENLFAGFSYVRSCSPATLPSLSDENIGAPNRSDENIGGGLGGSGSEEIVSETAPTKE